MKKDPHPEDFFCKDICELLSEKLQSQKLEYQVKNRIKILKDIIIIKEKNVDNCYLNFNFFEQDIVIYRESDNIRILKHEKSRIKFNRCRDNVIVVPHVIVETKLGVNSHALIAYSTIAEDIKKIFPSAKYFLLIRYTSKHEELRRHGRNFDGIFILENKSRAERKYEKGMLQKDITSNNGIKQEFERFLNEVTTALKRKN
jgi:hypothetical protein